MFLSGPPATLQLIPPLALITGEGFPAHWKVPDAEVLLANNVDQFQVSALSALRSTTQVDQTRVPQLPPRLPVVALENPAPIA